MVIKGIGNDKECVGYNVDIFDNLNEGKKVGVEFVNRKGSFVGILYGWIDGIIEILIGTDERIEKGEDLGCIEGIWDVVW